VRKETCDECSGSRLAEPGDDEPQQPDRRIFSEEAPPGSLPDEHPIVHGHDISVEEVGQILQIPLSLLGAVEPACHLQDGHDSRRRDEHVGKTTIRQADAVVCQQLEAGEVHADTRVGPDEDTVREVHVADGQEIDRGSAAVEPALLVAWVRRPVFRRRQGLAELLKHDIDSQVEAHGDPIRRELAQHDQRGGAHDVQALVGPELRQRSEGLFLLRSPSLPQPNCARRSAAARSARSPRWSMSSAWTSNGWADWTPPPSQMGEPLCQASGPGRLNTWIGPWGSLPGGRVALDSRTCRVTRSPTKVPPCLVAAMPPPQAYRSSTIASKRRTSTSRPPSGIRYRPMKRAGRRMSV